MKISLVQMLVLGSPCENLKKISELVQTAANDGGELVVLPEMCCCKYDNSSFVSNAMCTDDPFIKGMSDIAKANKIVLVAGSVPEREGDKIYNTSYVFDENGIIIAKHRKTHLFDINVKDGISFRESDTFSAGDGLTIFDTKWGKIGLIICFDIRFQEYIKPCCKDLKMIVVPASFNMSTGPAHWELLFRARAVDNQVFMAGCASALDENASYHSYGHSIITNPWGDAVAQLETEEAILTYDINIDMVNDIRGQIPLYN